MVHLAILLFYIGIHASDPDEKLKEAIKTTIKEEVTKEMYDIVDKATNDMREDLERRIDYLISGKEGEEDVMVNVSMQDTEEGKEEMSATFILKKVGESLGILVILLLIIYLVTKIFEYYRKLKDCSEGGFEDYDNL
ncbi:hypothetical protein EHEL_081840 [Encephalitozoon hellem ATCC 50504]|uniref:Uncharacterized protein n=1 Tax=Encephalitozoon hellem TaxID=27973 RepID=A0A9Q9CDH9_ENCHE|nr:uncharacterized protein EHEL_081840 [Encephalitozoon hellem ATCC 50504]AFM98883.1 hypothetical protein EHEL_081840 [Encephalitozoon hellem ATCC 50504]UTX43863.1 hypothetical protein GPU96_08g16380 [Encephalitozoon hellem]|eukprot:XP_003887864.1 hypothetical protein EHEL_081840 [Encephalitozoon hellem ATCC 50504]